MRDVIDAADLVLDHVRGPVADPAGIEQTVVGERARPHELRPRIVVLGVVPNLRGLSDDGLHRRLDQAVGEADVRHVGEITLHQVRHDVHRAAGHLERRQAEAQLGVHD